MTVRKDKYVGASISLFIMAIIWGMAYIGVQDAIDSGWGTFAILFVRCLLAGIIVMCFTFRKNYNDKGLFKGGIICGITGFLGLGLSMFGQQYTTISSTAFITSLYIIFVPVLNRLIFKQKESVVVFICCAISIIGCLLLNFEWPLALSKVNLLGNMIELAGALFFAIQIIYISKYSKKYDVLQLTTIELYTMAFLALVAVSLLDQANTVSVNGLFSVIWVGILSSGLCSVFQMYGQKYLPSALAGILMGLESLFGLLFAILIYHEHLGVTQIVGSALILIAVILCQFNYHKRMEFEPVEDVKEDTKLLNKNQKDEEK